MRQYDSRAWRLVEALDNAPFNVDERVEMVQRFLDEEREEAKKPSEVVVISPENAPEGF